jgi:hypothetical protein
MPSFAFRQQQFISRGNTEYASLETEKSRYLTVNGQQFVPNDRSRVLLPLVFCRECGQEYYTVRKVRDRESGLTIFLPREFGERGSEDGGDAGFLHFNNNDPWPTETSDILDKLPEDWIEEYNGELRVRSGQRKYLPETFQVTPLGQVSEKGIVAQFITTPFRFCLHCDVTYGSRQSSDFSKLTELSSGGRSTDTTILSLSLIRNLRKDPELLPKA